MIIVELVDDETREHKYSDENVMIRQIETGILYEVRFTNVCKLLCASTNGKFKH